jgi:hypothetical protein
MADTQHVSKSIMQLAEERYIAEGRIIAALAHMPRARAMSIIMGWLSVSDLKSLATFQERRS